MAEQPLAGRHVAVTGGTGALGQVVVARLIAAGATCHVPSHREGATDEGDDQLRITSGVELTDEAAVAGFYDSIPRLWASVHLAGGFAMAPLAATGREEFLRLFEMNSLTALLCCRAAASAMRRTGAGGRIVNVAARPALEPRKGAKMVAYATSKAAVAVLTQALAEELKGEGIYVNAIAPSTIDTPANRAAMPKADPSKWLNPSAAAEAVLHLILPLDTEVSGAVLPLYARA